MDRAKRIEGLQEHLRLARDNAHAEALRVQEQILELFGDGPRCHVVFDRYTLGRFGKNWTFFDRRTNQVLASWSAKQARLFAQAMRKLGPDKWADAIADALVFAIQEIEGCSP